MPCNARPEAFGFLYILYADTPRFVQNSGGWVWGLYRLYRARHGVRWGKGFGEWWVVWGERFGLRR